MNYLKKTLEYLFVLESGRRILLLFLLSLPAGIAMSFLIPVRAIYNWMNQYRTGNVDFWHAWNLGGGTYGFWIALAAAFVMMVIVVAVLSSVTSRSLRVGSFRITRIFDEFNESFFSSLFTVTVYFLIFLIGKTLLTLFLVLWQTVRLFVVSAALSVFSLAAVLFGVCVFSSLALLFLPLMTFNGLKPADAFVKSIEKCGRQIWKIVLSLALPACVTIAIGILFGFFGIPLLSRIIDSIMYALMTAYLIPLTMVSYYEIEQIKREDYPREFFFRNKK